MTRLASRLDGMDPRGHVVRDVDPDLVETDPEALLGMLCAHLEDARSPLREPGRATAIADLARQAGAGHDVTPLDLRFEDYEAHALQALALSLADGVNDLALQQDAATRLVF